MTSSRNRPGVCVLLTDKTREMVLTPSALERLRAVADVRLAPAEAADWDLTALLSDCVACLTGWGTPSIPGDVLDKCPDLGLVAHTAGSVRRLVPAERVGRDVRVSQAAAVIAESVAEHVLTQILLCLRELHLHDRGLRDGRGWMDLRTAYPGRLLGAATVGVIGASRTGRAVLGLLRAFGARLLLVDPTVDAAQARALGVELVDQDTLLRTADVVTLHAPLLPSTEGLIGRRELGLLRGGAVLINSARGGLVDADALHAEVTSGRITAALDVFEEEPLPPDSRWRSTPGVLLSPHAAGHTVDSHRRQGDAMVAEVEAFLRAEDLSYEVTAEMAALLA